MAKKFGSTSKFDTLEKGQITFTLKEETYKDETRYKFTGKIELSDSEFILVNIPVDDKNKVLAYKGKGDNEDKEYMRGYATRLKATRNKR